MIHWVRFLMLCPTLQPEHTHTHTTMIKIIHLICETFSAKNLTSVYTSPPPLCLQWPPDIWAFYPSISTLQGKQRGWECRSRGRLRVCSVFLGFVLPLVVPCAPLSLPLSYTHLVLTCSVQICVWARHPELSLMDHCFLASHFPESYSGQRNLCRCSRTCSGARSCTQ